MRLVSRKGIGSVTTLRQRNFETDSLHQYLQLLEKSLERYKYLRQSGAPDILVDSEKALIARQLQSLSRLSSELSG
jgi:hypothetical protein